MNRLKIASQFRFEIQRKLLLAVNKVTVIESGKFCRDEGDKFNEDRCLNEVEGSLAKRSIKVLHFIVISDKEGRQSMY